MYLRNLGLLIVVLAATLLLGACGADPEPASDSEAQTKQPTQLEQTIAPQLDALEKAKNVEQDLQDSVDARREEMEENGI